MPGSSDDEGDSRTASVGLARLQSNRNTSSSVSRAGSKDNSGRKGSQKNDKSKRSDFQDFVPRGGKFTTNPLALDPENSNSSSGSDSLENDEAPEQKMNKRRKTNAPAINWNQASRSTIRTTLGARTAPNKVKKQTKSAFDTVNDKYFRSRSASASDGEKHGDNHADSVKVGQYADEKPKTYFVDDSDGSDTGEVSEGDDSMMLNIGQHDRHGLDGAQDNSDLPFVVDTSPTSNPAPVSTSISRVEQQQQNKSEIQENGSVLSDHSDTQLPPQSKAEAFAEFAAIYSSSPAILADLEVKDLEKQARFFFYNSNIHDLNLTRPISCTECLQEGHLAFICPSKECTNCGAWNLHEDRLCPLVRRCQRCREVGHDSHACPSSLKASATETPCDYCGADTHTEHDCDKMWKFPRVEPLDGPIKVSISCSYCTNKNHLLGDCPLKKVPTTSSTFSLKEYLPSMITNLNSVLGPRRSDDPGMSIRGRAGHPQDSPSPDEDDGLILHNSRPQPSFRGGRGKINFRGSLGQSRGLRGDPPPPLPREPPPPPIRDYRDRDGDFHRPRQRSRSPGPGNYRGPNSGPPPRPFRGGRGRGRGRGRDQYRPGRP